MKNNRILCVLFLMCFLLACGKGKSIQKSGDNEVLNVPTSSNQAVRFVLIDLGQSKNVPKNALSMFRCANSDVESIILGQTPKYSYMSGVFSDGGTKIYTSPNYVITEWHEIRKIQGVNCIKRGVSIKFNDPIPNNSGLLDDFAHTWIEVGKQ